MIIRKGTSIRYPVRLTNSSGTGVTGIATSSISDGTTAGNVTFVRGDGTLVSIALSAGSNFFEVSAAKAPGLYHVLVPSSATGVLGACQLCVFPSVSDFVGAVFTADIETVSADAELTRKITTNRWKIATSGAEANRLVIYDDDGTTVWKRFALKDSVGDPTFVNPFERSPV